MMKENTVLNRRWHLIVAYLVSKIKWCFCQRLCYFMTIPCQSLSIQPLIRGHFAVSQGWLFNGVRQFIRMDCYSHPTMMASSLSSEIQNASSITVLTSYFSLCLCVVFPFFRFFLLYSCRISSHFFFFVFALACSALPIFIVFNDYFLCCKEIFCD